MLQLRETLDCIEKNYAEEYAAAGCFAAVAKDVLFSYAVNNETRGVLTLNPGAANVPACTEESPEDDGLWDDAYD